MSLRRNFISGVKWTSFSTVIKAIFQLSQIAILSRFLPTEDFGLVAVALFVINFSNIFADMGISTAILHRQHSTLSEYSSLYWFSIALSLVLYGVLFLVTPFVAAFYDQSQLAHIIPILGLNLIFVTLGRQHYTILLKQLKFKQIAIVEFISIPLGLIAAIGFVLNNYGVYSLIYSTLITSLISNIWFLGSNLRTNPILLHFKIQEIKPFFKIGGYSTGSAFLDFISREIDILIVGKVLGTESLGTYSLIKQVITKLYSIINPIVLKVLNPLMATLQHEREKLKHTYLKTIKYLSYINFPVYTMMVVLAEEIILILYGQSYTESHLMLALFAGAYFIMTISNPVGSLQIATGRTDLGFKWTVIRIAITPIVIYIGTLISVTAVAGMFAILSFVLLIPLWYVQIRPVLNISVTEYLLSLIKPVAFFVIVSTLFVTVPVFSFEEYRLFHRVILKLLIMASLALSLTYLFDRTNYSKFVYLIISMGKFRFVR